MKYIIFTIIFIAGITAGIGIQMKVEKVYRPHASLEWMDKL